MNHCAIFRRCLRVAAGCLGVAAVLLLAAVMPGLWRDTFPLATPRQAAVGTAVVAVATAALAWWLLRVARRGAFTGWSWRVGLFGAAIPMLLLTVAVLDGALTIWGHGGAMRPVSLVMFACAGLEFVAAMLTLAAAALWLLDGQRE